MLILVRYAPGSQPSQRDRRTGDIIIDTSDGPIRITIREASGSRASVAVDAPKACRITRGELIERDVEGVPA